MQLSLLARLAIHNLLEPRDLKVSTSGFQVLGTKVLGI